MSRLPPSPHPVCGSHVLPFQSLCRTVFSSLPCPPGAHPAAETSISTSSPKPIDFRKGTDSLAAVVMQAPASDPFTSDIFPSKPRSEDFCLA